MDKLPDWVFKTFWTGVASALSYLSANLVLDLGPVWTVPVTTGLTAVLVAVRQWVADRLAAPEADPFPPT